MNAVNSDPCSLEAPGELIREENVSHLRRPVRVELAVVFLSLKIFQKRRARYWNACSYVHNPAGGRLTNQIDHQVSKQKRRKVVDGEGFFYTFRREFSPRKRGPRIVNKYVNAGQLFMKFSRQFPNGRLQCEVRDKEPGGRARDVADGGECSFSSIGVSA